MDNSRFLMLTLALFAGSIWLVSITNGSGQVVVERRESQASSSYTQPSTVQKHYSGDKLNERVQEPFQSSAAPADEMKKASVEEMKKIVCDAPCPVCPLYDGVNCNLLRIDGQLGTAPKVI
jgi:hypothetical protein